MTYHYNTRWHHLVKWQLRAETISSLLKQQYFAKYFHFLIVIIAFSLTILICENQEILRNQEKWHLCKSNNSFTLEKTLRVFNKHCTYLGTQTTRVVRYSESNTKSCFLTRSPRFRVSRLPLKKEEHLFL